MRKLVLKVTQEKRNGNVIRVAHLFGPNLPEELRLKGVTFEFLDKIKVPELNSYDGFIFAFIHYAMSNFDEFEIDGPVTAHGLRNIQIYQEAWHCFIPDQYKIINISAKRIIENNKLKHKKKDLAISAFSGGMDATFLALRHANDSCLGEARYPLDTLCMVHGFDVKYENDDGFEKLTQRVLPLIKDLKLNHVRVKTNIRELIQQNWEQSFGAQLSCVLHQFSGKYSYALIGSGEPYNRLIFPWGSTPATDYLLSSGEMQLIHEGAGYSRIEKAKLIAQNAIARKTLKVCWEGVNQHENCGICEKCIRTQLDFYAINEKAIECFDKPLDMDLIKRINVRNLAQLNALELILNYATEQEIEEEWVEHLKHVIEINNKKFKILS